MNLLKKQLYNNRSQTVRKSATAAAALWESSHMEQQLEPKLQQHECH